MKARLPHLDTAGRDRLRRLIAALACNIAVSAGDHTQGAVHRAVIEEAPCQPK